MTMFASLGDLFFLEGNDGFWVSAFWFILTIVFSVLSYKASKALPRWVGSYHSLVKKVCDEVKRSAGYTDGGTEADLEMELANDRTQSTARWRQRWLVFCVIMATFSFCSFMYST